MLEILGSKTLISNIYFFKLYFHFLHRKYLSPVKKYFISTGLRNDDLKKSSLL